MDANKFIRNCNAHTPEELAAYVEQHVAWSEDGRQILAHAAGLAGLYQELDLKGITRYVIDFIPAGDISCLGGSEL